MVDPAELSALTDQLETLRARAESADAAAQQHESALATSRTEARRLKTRVETQDILYTSLRSELEVKKDQIRQQREELERLRAYKVVLVDAPAPDES